MRNFKLYLAAVIFLTGAAFYLNDRAFAKEPDARRQGPDLIVAKIVNLDKPLSINETRLITITIANNNLIDARNVKVKYEFYNLTLDDPLPIHGFVEGEIFFPLIPKEYAMNFIVEYRGRYPADYQLRVWVDPQNLVGETNEGNNFMEKNFSVEGEITAEMFFADKDVDLSMRENIKVSNPQPLAGVPVRFEVVVQNLSDIKLWGVDLDMFVNEKLVSSQALGTFEADGLKRLTFYHPFLVARNYKVKFIVDAKGIVPERNKKNNVTTISLEVKPGVFGTGHRDLTVSQFSLSRATSLEGEPITAKAIIKNVGKDSLNFILCTIAPQGKKPFYVKVLPVLDPQEQVEISTKLPQLFAGDYIIEARVDGKNIISEENEYNNVKSASLHIEPIAEDQTKAQRVNIIVKGINKVHQTFNRWLKGLRKPKK